MRRPQSSPVAFALLVTGLLGFWIWKSATDGSSAAEKSSGAPPAPAVTSPSPASGSISPAILGDKPAPDDARQTLQDLRASLLAMPKEESVGKIRGVLDRGEDRSTGLFFEIAKDGALTEWPSFRTFLLDTLFSIDPAAAAEMGREILAQPTTADEWALALRNVAKGESRPDAEFLRRKTEELIANQGWQANPSIGYLNAFDVLVHVDATDSAPLLSDLIQRKDRKDLAHAGFLTLDRLVQRQPVEMLERLTIDSSLQQSRPEMVAQQFARADVRDAAQRELVKSWLLDPTRTATELRSFAGVYPNNNRFISNNLLTAEAGQSGEDLAAHDREALAVIDAWAADPAFGPIKDHLATMISRLDGFVGVRNGNSDSPPSQ